MSTTALLYIIYVEDSQPEVSYRNISIQHNIFYNGEKKLVSIWPSHACLFLSRGSFSLLGPAFLSSMQISTGGNPLKISILMPHPAILSR